MTPEEWLALFPQGSITTTYPTTTTTDLVLTINDGSYLLLKYSDLSPREVALLSLTQIDARQPVATRTPWQRYLEDGGQHPSSPSNIQFIHIYLLQKNTDFNESEWIQMMSDLLGDTIVAFRCFHKHYTFVRNATTPLTLDAMKQWHETIEEDFAITMTPFLGNNWGTLSDLTHLYQAEKALFVAYLHASNRQRLLDFPTLALWGLTSDKADMTPIPARLVSLMEEEDIPSIVTALWVEHAVLTKAAARLYIHRNTLQYRIDRFYERSGLNLKNMDDLTLCHLLLQQQEY